jgi:hypothetical protein
MRRHPALRRESQLAARAAIALTALVLLADSIVSLWTGLYLNLGGGVWLALARDVADGIFYRPIWNGAEYGGTRYFPMLFVPIGALIRLGMPEVPAGLVISVAGMLAMGVSVAWLLARWSVPRPLALFGGALALAPYFVHQTGFAIRCEPIAAAFAIAGLAVLGPLDPPNLTTRRLAIAAVLFVAGFAAKITCVYAPAAAVVALLLTRRNSEAVRLALFTAGAAVVFLLTVHVVSEGRALESFRACALAGSDPGSLLSLETIVRPMQLVAGSHILTLVFLMTWAAMFLTRGLWREVPGLLFLAVLGVTVVIFASPGTIITSHIVDAYAAAIVVLVIAVARARPRWELAGMAALLLVTAWAAGQNVRRIVSIVKYEMPQAAQDRRDLLDAIRSCGAPWIAESPLIPVFAGQRPVILDPFSYHVIGLTHPDIARSLPERIARQEFSCVVLERDLADRGRDWYRNVNLSDEVASAVLAHYSFDRVVAGQRFHRARR